MSISQGKAETHAKPGAVSRPAPSRGMMLFVSVVYVLIGVLIGSWIWARYLG